MHTARSEDPADYTVVVQDKVQQENAVIKQAFAILASRMPTLDAMHTPGAVREYLTLRNATHSDQYRERFCVMWLDNQNRVLATETMAEGTISQTSVYPREVVRAALRHNAAAVVLTHNHPSGSVQPSRADEHLTLTLKSALALVDVRVIDHIITSPNGNSLSMAEQGLI